jgi:hypothetical protein
MSHNTSATLAVATDILSRLQDLPEEHLTEDCKISTRKFKDLFPEFREVPRTTFSDAQNLLQGKPPSEAAQWNLDAVYEEVGLVTLEEIGWALEGRSFKKLTADDYFP